MARTITRVTVALFAVAAFPLLGASSCKKDDVPVVPEAAPPPPEVEAGPVDLLPLVEDAGLDAGPDAAKKATGPYVPTNVARLKQCCAQLSSQAKALGSSPEAGMLIQAAASCNQTAAGIAPGSNAPEMGIIRTLLAGKNLPAVCQGF